MAIDGTKIVDSDLGHDVYNEFMDLYDAGAELAEIRKKLDVWRNEILCEEEFEIFITVYAFALWETGSLDGETLDEVRNTIAKKAGFRMWMEESGPADAQDRAKVLDRFQKKISTPKNTVRKRKKYKKVTNLILQNYDVVIFQMPDRSYRAAIMVNAEQIRRNMVYKFAKTSFASDTPPSSTDICCSSVFMHRIDSMFAKDQLKREQPGIEKFWRRDDSFTVPFILGLSLEFIEHRDLIRFAHEFEVIGQFKIAEGFKRAGSFGYCSNFTDFCSRFENLMDREIITWKSEAVALAEIEHKPDTTFVKRLVSRFTRNR